MQHVVEMKPLKPGEPCPECGQWFGYGANAPGNKGGQPTPTHIPKVPDKGWIQTATGGRFYFLEQKLSSIKLTDIGAALSKLCRFTGHCRKYYSIAEHSYYVSLLVPEEHAFHAMLHDASEAYLGDVSTPLKSLLDEYRVLEDSVSRSIYARFDLPAELPKCIKTADYRMLATEVPLLFDLVDEGWKGWLTGYKPVTDITRDSIGWKPESAEHLFNERIQYLWERHARNRRPATSGRTSRLLNTVNGRPLTHYQTVSDT